MGIITRSADLYYTYKFLRLLTIPWKQTDAFQLGIIDGNGKLLIKPSQFTTSEQRDAYSYFDRLVFNIRRLLEKAGAGSRIASYAAALYLIKDNFNISDSSIEMIFKKMELDINTENITESWYILGDDTLSPGSYTLVQDIQIPSTGELAARKGTRVIVHEHTLPSGHIFNEPIYKVKHVQTKQEIFVAATDLIR